MDEVPVKSSGQVDVVRVGDTVRRPLQANSAAVHALLRHLEAVGFAGAPRVLGVDDAGREVLTWIDGEAGSPGGESDARVASEAALIRRFHGAVGGFELPRGVAFVPPNEARSTGDVPCHNDLAPNNTVFVGDEAVAIIDWNAAGWGSRLWDLSYGAWRAVPLYDPEWLPDRFHADPHHQARRLRLYVDAYGLDAGDREALLATLVERQEQIASVAHDQGRDGTRFRRNARYVEANRNLWDAAMLG